MQADSVAEGVLHAHGEGVVADEPLHFQLSEGEARVRTWELTDKAEGHYVVPWSDLHSLPEISCTEMVIPAIATTAKIANAS